MQDSLLAVLFNHLSQPASDRPSKQSGVLISHWECEAGMPDVVSVHSSNCHGNVRDVCICHMNDALTVKVIQCILHTGLNRRTSKASLDIYKCRTHQRSSAAPIVNAVLGLKRRQHQSHFQHTALIVILTHAGKVIIVTDGSCEGAVRINVVGVEEIVPQIISCQVIPFAVFKGYVRTIPSNVEGKVMSNKSVIIVPTLPQMERPKEVGVYCRVSTRSQNTMGILFS